MVIIFDTEFGLKRIENKSYSKRGKECGRKFTKGIRNPKISKISTFTINNSFFLRFLMYFFFRFLALTSNVYTCKKYKFIKLLHLT